MKRPDEAINDFRAALYGSINRQQKNIRKMSAPVLVRIDNWLKHMEAENIRLKERNGELVEVARGIIKYSRPTAGNFLVSTHQMQTLIKTIAKAEATLQEDKE